MHNIFSAPQMQFYIHNKYYTRNKRYSKIEVNEEILSMGNFWLIFWYKKLFFLYPN